MDAWYSTVPDVKESLGNVEDYHVHTFVVDVVKSLDTVDTWILDCPLKRLGLRSRFRHVYFEFHDNVRLRFNLASGVGRSVDKIRWHPSRLSPQHGIYCCALITQV